MEEKEIIDMLNYNLVDHVEENLKIISWGYDFLNELNDTLKDHLGLHQNKES